MHIKTFQAHVVPEDQVSHVMNRDIFLAAIMYVLCVLFSNGRCMCIYMYDSDPLSRCLKTS